MPLTTTQIATLKTIAAADQTAAALMDSADASHIRS